MTSRPSSVTVDLYSLSVTEDKYEGVSLVLVALVWNLLKTMAILTEIWF